MKNNDIFKAKLLLTNDMIEPDPILVSSKFPPSPTHAISKDKQGNVISVFGDNKWDFSEYDINSKSRILSFNYWAENVNSEQVNTIINEMKQLIFIYIWFRKGSKFKVKCITDLGFILNIFGRYCLESSLTLKELLCSEKHLSICLFSLKPSTMYSTRRFLLAFKKIDKNLNPFLIYDLKSLPLLSKLIINYRNSLKQVSPIPPRIYLSYTNLINDKVNMLYSKIDNLISFIAEVKTLSDELKSMTYNQRYVKNDTTSDFDNLIQTHFTDVFFENFNANKTIPGTVYLINSVFFTCRLAIQMYTGMRVGEAKLLMSECAHTYIKNDNKYYIINGKTTKLGERETRWITNETGYKAVAIASKISKFIADSTPDIEKKKNAIPLFIRASYLGLFLPPPKRNSETFLTAELDSFDELRKTDWLNIKITEEDIIELKKIDPFRAWESESEFDVGKYWPLQTHQFRRSLALYCARSGLVSLTSLKRQLQHLSIQMTLYYSKGSNFAKNLLDQENTHFASEFQDAQSYTQALDYLNLVTDFKTKYFGVQGKIINKSSNVSFNREQTLKKFKLGQLSYTETCLGGCTSIDPCDQRATRTLVGCIDCKNAVLKRDKLELVVLAQKNLVNKLENDSLEYRTESDDLKLLEKTLKYISSK